MGCTQSKIDQDEAVARCKERKHILSVAVSARNAFAAAHSSYAISLKNTGAALSDYSLAELSASGDTSSNINSNSVVDSSSSAVAPPPPLPVENLFPPPPPLPVDIAPPLQRSVSMPDIPVPQVTKKKADVEVVIEEEEEDEDDEDHDEHDDFEDDSDESDEDEDDEEEEDHHSLSKPSRHHLQQPLRRSDPIPSNITINNSPPAPPRPPSSKPSNPAPPQQQPAINNPPLPPANNGAWEWDYFFGAADSMPPSTLEETPPPYDPPKEEPKFEKVEKIPKVEKIERSEKIERTETIENFEKPVPPPPLPSKVIETPVYEPQKVPKKVKSSSADYNTSNSFNNSTNNYTNTTNNYTTTTTTAPNISMETGSGSNSSSFKKGRIVSVAGPTISSMSLLKVINQLDDHFLKAYESAADVTKMLEAARLHYHSNFAGSKGHIDHSAKIMRVITWNRSFKGLPQHEDDMEDKKEKEEETHATILDKMLAWEKKLYDEVKAGEVMKVDYQRKVSLLNKQKKKGVRPDILEKTKAAVSHLHTRYIVDMQSMDSTVSEINHLRDGLLYPKLVQLVSGMARMWRTMHDHHRSQLKLVLELQKSPIEIPLPLHGTSPEHFRQTAQLHGTVKELHSQLQKLMDNQREYVGNLNNWLKLNLIPIEGGLREKVSSPAREANPAIKYLLRAWNDYVGKLPLELAKTAILSFSEVIRTILLLQEDELTAKRRCEDTSRELDRKKRQFEDWSRKVMERRNQSTNETDPEPNPNQDPIVERRIQIEQLELKLREEQENHRRLCKQVREKSIGSLRTHLPELFRALLEFALASSEMYRSLESVAKESREQVSD